MGLYVNCVSTVHLGPEWMLARSEWMCVQVCKSTSISICVWLFVHVCVHSSVLQERDVDHTTSTSTSTSISISTSIPACPLAEVLIPAWILHQRGPRGDPGVVHYSRARQAVQSGYKWSRARRFISAPARIKTLPASLPARPPACRCQTAASLLGCFVLAPFKPPLSLKMRFITTIELYLLCA